MNSSKRQSQFAEFQDFLKLEPHILLHPSQTRWLSVELVVNRLLEQWSALTLFSNDQWMVMRVVSAETIWQCLHDPYAKLYLHFLSWILPKFTDFNRHFQSEKVVVTNLHEEIRELYKFILLCFMRRSYVVSRNLSAVDPNDATQFTSDSELYVGVPVRNGLGKIPNAKPSETAEFLRCRQFFQVAATQLRSKYNMDDPLLSLLPTLKPANALSLPFHDEVGSLHPLMTAMPRALTVQDDANSQNIDDQWRRLLLALAKGPDNLRSIEECDVFWDKLLKDVPDFKELAEFVLGNAKCVLTIPHSNAQCERIFSKVNLIKTKPRNKLLARTVNGAILASECVTQGGGGGTCISFEPSPGMYSRMTATNLYTRKEDGTDSEDVREVEITFAD